MNDNILFYDVDAVCKYNVDKNGLYLNDEKGLKDFSTPYYGVTYNPKSKLYIPIPHIKKSLIEEIIEHPQIKLCIKKGLSINKIEDGWPIEMPGVKDIRDAAYIAQLFRFGENNKDLIISYYLHKYVEPDEEIIKLFEGVNDWLYEPVIREYDPKNNNFKIKQSIIDKAKREKIRRKQELLKKETLRLNEINLIQRMTEYAKKKGYIISNMTLDIAKKLLAIKNTEENKKKEEYENNLNSIMLNKNLQKLEQSKIILNNIREQERKLKVA